MDDYLRGIIISSLECGRTQMEISEKIGVAQSVNSRLWQRYQDDANLSNATVTRKTVYRRLGFIGLYACTLVRCFGLTTTHYCHGVAKSIEHAIWTSSQWACVMFSDKSRFTRQSDSLRTFKWKSVSTRYLKATSLNGTVTVVQGYSRAFRGNYTGLQNSSNRNHVQPNLSEHNSETCKFVWGCHDCGISLYG
ncbi:HTH_Tnp_Tc3_2 domain-containing protein [Trichonephila clavipes]|nr:HTH_Tnp_Tc3_2 domain-containing protein [Trichonephila clavipes]